MDNQEQVSSEESIVLKLLLIRALAGQGEIVSKVLDELGLWTRFKDFCANEVFGAPKYATVFRQGMDAAFYPEMDLVK